MSYEIIKAWENKYHTVSKKIENIYEECIEGVNDTEYSEDVRNHIIFWLDKFKEGIFEE